MALNKDLETYKESTEFKNILTKISNKIERLEAEIESVYNWEEVTWTDTSIEDLKHLMCKNEFDVKDKWIEYLDWIIGEIKHEKGKELKEFYNNRKDNAKLFLYQPITNGWMSNSILRYTELDMKRFERANFFGLERDIDALIWTEDQKPKTNEWAF